MPWVSTEMYRCSKCGETKPNAEFYFHRREQKYWGWCRACERARWADPEYREKHRLGNLRWARKNRTRLKLLSRAYRRAHGAKRRLRKVTQWGVWCGWHSKRHGKELFDIAAGRYRMYCRNGIREYERVRKHLKKGAPTRPVSPALISLDEYFGGL